MRNVKHFPRRLLPLFAGAVLLAGCQIGLAPEDEAIVDARLVPLDGSPTPYLLRAEAHLGLANYAAAIADAGEAYRLATRPGHAGGGDEQMLRTIRSLGALALAHALAGDPAQSQHYLKLLADLPVGAGAANAQTLAAQQRAVARAHMARREFAQALDALGREDGGSARALVDRVLGGAEEFNARSALSRLYMIAKCLLETGHAVEARQVFDRLLRNPHVPGAGEIYSLALFERGSIADRMGDITDALEHYVGAIEAIERRSVTARSAAGRIGLAGDKQAAYAALVRLLINGGEATSAFEYAGRANAYREVVAAQQAIDAAGPDPSALVSVTFLAADEVQSLLAQGETLVEFHQAGEDLIAFVATDRELHAVPLDTADLGHDVRLFRKQLAVANSAEFMTWARRLHDRLILPIADRLGPGPLTIVARGSLRELPFAALHDGESYLVGRHALRILANTGALRPAPETVASLWAGDEAANAYLKARYRDGARFDDRREALRQAQLATMKRYPHPYYWAGFQITASGR